MKIMSCFSILPSSTPIIFLPRFRLVFGLVFGLAKAGYHLVVWWEELSLYAKGSKFPNSLIPTHYLLCLYIHYNHYNITCKVTFIRISTSLSSLPLPFNLTFFLAYHQSNQLFVCMLINCNFSSLAFRFSFTVVFH